jgi:hypothetical protein
VAVWPSRAFVTVWCLSWEGALLWLWQRVDGIIGGASEIIYKIHTRSYNRSF